MPPTNRIELKEEGRHFWKKTVENIPKKKESEGRNMIRERRTYAGPMNMGRNRRKKEESTKK